MAESFDDTTDLKALVTKLIAARNIKYRDYQRISELVLADGSVDEAERVEINRMFDAIRTGRVKIVD